jgi:Flp pilus assembly protein TadG
MMVMRKDSSGQALIELSVVLSLLAIFAFGTFDFGRAVYDGEVIKNLSGEGSSLASRGSSLPNAVTAVVSDSDLDMTDNGCVIMSTVTNGATPGSYVISAQATSSPCVSASSRIGCYPVSQTCSAMATIPTQVQTVLTAMPNSTVYVTEVFYKFTAASPVGSFLHNSNVLPTQLYSVAYF